LTAVENCSTVPFRNVNVCGSLIQLMPCAKPNDLHLVFVKLQAITGYPIANAFEAADEAFNCFLARGRWYTDIQLRIVCISMAGETELRHNVKQFRHVQQKQQWA